jgi:hypothetical protein
MFHVQEMIIVCNAYSVVSAENWSCVGNLLQFKHTKDNFMYNTSLE